MLTPFVGVVGAANAADSAAVLRLTKTITNPSDPSKLAPGDTFTYQITVNCDQQDCDNASLSDVLPAEFAQYGFTFGSGTPVTTSPSASQVPRDMSWSGCTPSAGATVTADCALNVKFGTADDPSMSAGTNFTVNITLRVPTDLKPGSPLDGDSITNKASAQADNYNDGTPITDDATIGIVVPVTSGLDITKDWSPASQEFNPGAASTITINGTVTSNKDGNKLVIQDPQTAAAGASELDTSNPFTSVDFSGFGDITAPAGTTGTAYDFYVKTGTGYQWVSGTINGPPAPYANSNVAGTRVTFTGDIAQTATASIPVDVVQRSVTRDDSADLSDGWTKNNVAAGDYSVDGAKDATDTAGAKFVVNAPDVSVDTEKTIDPASIAVGQTAAGAIKTTNTSNVPVSHLHVEDLNYFSDSLKFDGFTEPIAYPSGATAGTVTWHFSDGTTSTVDISDGNTPTPPAGETVTGFELDFTSPTDAIASGATTTASFNIVPQPSYVPSTDPVSSTNTVNASVSTKAGKSGTDTDTAALEVYAPKISTKIDKSVSPSSAVNPGDSVIAALAAGKGDDPDSFTQATEYLVGDSAPASTDDSKCTSMWNAFNLTGVAPTQIPAQTSLTIQYQTADGTWHDLVSYPKGDAQLVGGTLAELAAAGGVAAPSANDVLGIRFDFKNANGFSDGTVVTPYLTYQARDSARFDGCDFPQPGGDATTYTNTATVDATAPDPGNPNEPITAHDSDNANAAVIVPEAGGPGVGIQKHWSKDALVAQSGDTAGTTLDWNVQGTKNYNSVVISDPNGGESDPENSVFQAFNLQSIDGVDFSSTPYSNGWYMKYDSVTKIELFENGEWTTVTAPAGSWMSASGFKGYKLSSDEQTNVTGIRVTLEPNDAARTAAQEPGANFDPYAPAAGSGIAHTVGGSREFNLQWQLRNVKRVVDNGSKWVNPDQTFNADPATGTQTNVNNTVGLDANYSDNGIDHVSDSDVINIVKTDPGLDVTKTATPTPPDTLVVPHYGDVDPANYPTASYTVTGKNTATGRAQVVRLVDPLPTCELGNTGGCATAVSLAGANANPFATATYDATTNPFNSQNITKLNIAADDTSEVSYADSVVWLWHFNGTATQYSITEANALSASDLADVVGVSVAFQGADPDTTGGTISQANTLTIGMDTQLRATLRGTSTPTTAANVGTTVQEQIPNATFGQTYDWAANANSVVTDNANAPITPVDAHLGVTATKSFNPGTILQTQSSADVTMMLGATSGDSTLAPDRVVVTDDQATNPAFWSTFKVKSIGEPAAFPSNADRVQVDLETSAGWQDGVAASTVASSLPSGVSLSDVIGIRYTYTKSDGSAFQNISWAVSAPVVVNVLDPDRDGNAVVYPSSYANTVVADSYRTLDGTTYNATDDDTATINLDSGTAALDIVKAPENGIHTVGVGDSNSWTITLKNTGTGYLNLTDVLDTLPATLTATGDATFKFDDGSTLAKPNTVIDPASNTVKFSFATADHGNRMNPGEQLTITLPLTLQPGVGSGQVATNSVVASTVQPLSSCTNKTGDQGTTGDWASDPQTCGTTNYVSPIPTSGLYIQKGVMGADSGAVNTKTPASTCSPTVNIANDPNSSSTDFNGNYYRTPCAANSHVDGVDKWVIRVANTSTQSATKFVIVDPLPFKGDQYLIGSSSRGSDYRPALVADSIKASLPAGLTATVELTKDVDPAPCKGTSDWTTDLDCDSANWFVPTSDADYASATGIRVVVDMNGKTFDPGQQALLTFQTKNVPVTTDASDPLEPRASVTQASADQFAWNQTAVVYRWKGAAADTFNSPILAGVHLQRTALEVKKITTGDAAAKYSPNEITATVQCTVGDDNVPVKFTDNGSTSTSEQVTLVKQSDGTYKSVRIDGLPFGNTNCSVAEDGDLGHFGETSRTITPENGELALETAVASSDVAVPDAQVATLSNTYDFSGLSVTKKVDTQATLGTFGPFTFNMKCTVANGTDTPTPVTFDGENSTSFSISNGQTWKAPADTIPVGATCVLTETDTSGANGTAFAPIDADGNVITGGNVVDNGPNSDGNPQATITVGKATSDVVSTLVTNHFDAGTFTVTKNVNGDGAELYGNGPFTFTSVCTYKGNQTLLDETYELAAGGSKTFGVFPAGTECVTHEVKTAGANESTIDPADGTIVIQKQTDGDSSEPAAATDTPSASASVSATPSASTGDDQSTLPPLSNVNVTATNTFNLGSLKINKVRNGAGVDLYGAGPFEAQAKCTWQKDGVTTPITLANDGLVSLNAANSYSAEIKNLPVGASCNVNETKTNGATSSSTDPADGNVTITDSATEPVTVTITNTFDVGSIKIIKKRVGPGASTLGDDTFVANVMCTRTVDGQKSNVSLPEGGNVSLSADNKYEATVDNVPIGSDCTIAETDHGQADSVKIDHPKVTVSEASPKAVVTITNHFPAAPNNGGNGGNGGNDGGNGNNGGNGHSLATTGLGLGALLAALGGIAAGGILVAMRYRRRRSE